MSRGKRKRESPLPDTFEIESINLMVSLMAQGLGDEAMAPVLDHLYKLSLQYAQAVEKIEALQDQVNYDARTGLLRYQSSYFENIFKNISRIFSSYNTPVGHDHYHLSYIRLDIDDFSFLNNRYSHHVGDEALRMVGDAIRRTIRPTDNAIRYGGEEFDIILTATPLDGAEGFLDRLYERFAEIRVPTGQESLRVTLSAGVSSVRMPYQEIVNFDRMRVESLNLSVQHQADNALYEAKYLGKNRYCIYDPTRETEYDRIRKEYASRPKK